MYVCERYSVSLHQIKESVSRVTDRNRNISHQQCDLNSPCSIAMGHVLWELYAKVAFGWDSLAHPRPGTMLKGEVLIFCVAVLLLRPRWNYQAVQSAF